MLSKATLDSISKIIGVSVEELTKGISSEEETSFTIPEGQFLTKEDRTTLEDNLEKKGYDRGATASREMVLKDMSKQAGLDETIKDPTRFLETLKSSILEEAQLEPNEKITTLESTIDSLRGKIQEKEDAFDKMVSDMKQKEIKTSVTSHIPDVSETIGLSKEEAASLFFNAYEIKEDGVYSNGNLVVDDVHRPVPLDQVVNGWVESKGWNKTEDNPRGRSKGKEAKGTNLPTTYDDYLNVLRSKGLSEASAEGQALLQEIAEKHPEVLD